MYMDSFRKRVTSNGSTRRDITINRHKDYIKKHAPDNPAYKKVIINDEERYIIINNGNNESSKTFICMPDEYINNGTLIKWNDMWLVTDSSSDKEICQKGTIERCNYKLRWINENRDIIETDCVVSFPFPYAYSVSEGKVITVDTTRCTIKIPYNDETKKIKADDRFFVTKSRDHPAPYKVEKANDVVGIRDEYGYILLAMRETQINVDEDNIELLICNYKKKEETSNVPSTDKKAAITAKPKYVVIGYKGTVVSASFTNNGEIVNDVIPKWTINCDFIEDLNVVYSSDKKTVTISTDKVSLSGRTFTVVLESEDGSYQSSSIALSIRGF